MQSVTSEAFGILPDGRRVQRFTLRREGLELQVIEFGATITRLRVPDRGGAVGDVVLGFDTLSEYVRDEAYHGALVGRCANRIARGRFTLGRDTFELACNDGPHHLHGGPEGFHRQVWRATPLLDRVGIELVYVSADGEGGYPGRVEARVRYILAEGGAVRIELAATTTKPTLVNLTQHAYFDLSAGAAADVLEHRVRLLADAYLPVDRTLIPTGEVRGVAGTPFDFRSGVVLRDALRDEAERGFDHTFVIRGAPGTPRPAAVVEEPETGRRLEVVTTEPGVQLYTGNFLDGSASGRGRELGRHAGLCLETQHFPDAINQPAFASPVLRPAEQYRSLTEWRFSAH